MGRPAVQLVKAGREHPVWFVNVLVDGRAVELIPLRRKADFVHAASEAIERLAR